MDESTTILKNPDRRPSRDYAFLRERGLRHIEQLSSDLWTDYNIHDPGITILEALCYAITDLGYRTDYDIEDLLADRAVPSPDDAKQFHSAREILTSRPVTLNDYRKLLIDIEGVKNAWLHPLKETTPKLYLDCKKGEWKTEPDDYREVNLRGLYDVTLELDEDAEAGDLNHYVYVIPLYADPGEGEAIEKLYVRLPDWSVWLNRGMKADEIDSVAIREIKQAPGSRITFEAVVEIATAEETYEETAEIEATDKDVPPASIKSRLDDESIADRYEQKVKSAVSIGWKAFGRLHENRSLCEDFEEFRSLEVEEIGVCADIELENDADLERALAEVYYRVDQHLAPPVYFYSLQEMMDREVPTEEIFEGPALNHGFIPSEELEKADIKREIYVSDILQVIMDVEGVKTVDNLVLNSAYAGETLNSSIEWQYEIGENRVPRFSRRRSDVDLFKEDLPYNVNQEKVDRFLKEMEQLQRNRKLSADEEHDLPIPGGADRNVTQFTSIQEDLPLNYGVGDAGISGTITEERRAKARQLKAYLTFYDQILANYLAQLGHLKNLFSFSDKLRRSYFYQVLFRLPEGFEFPANDPGSEVLYSDESSPRIYQVIKDFVAWLKEETSGPVTLHDYDSLRVKWEEYRKKTGLNSTDSTHFVKQLDRIVEDRQTFEERRNRFLDHLLARFGESFTDYVLLMYSREKGPRLASELITDKAEFLKEYPALSSSRGTGFNYKREDEIWDTHNVSGFKKRVSRLLGFDCYKRRSLSGKATDDLFEIYEDDAGEWRFRLKLSDMDITLRSEGYSRKQDCKRGIQAVKKLGIREENYERKTAVDGRFYFNLVAENSEIVGTSPMYDKEEQRDRALASTVVALCGREGFHMVEHILLRPGRQEDPKLPACPTETCNTCPGYLDPYSFRMSLVVPYWPERFNDMAFRRFMEKTIRKEAPAHVHVKICWVTKEDMEDFEEVYRNWLEVKSRDSPDAEEVRDKLRELIDVMKEIRSEYPSATLHDFEEDSRDNPMLLDNTAL